MHVGSSLLRAQMRLIRPATTSGDNLKTMRMLQEITGCLMTNRKAELCPVQIGRLDAEYAIPHNSRPERGILLYLHGGGFTAGRLEYARGFGSTLAVRTGFPVLYPAYRLAPEYPYPAALEDAYAAYQYLLEDGYDPSNIILCGESAGGGLCFSLCLYLKDRAERLPAGIVTVSAWTDLTLAGASCRENAKNDPLLTLTALQRDAENYLAGHSPLDPFVSPAFGDLTDLPPALLFAGENESLLKDTLTMHQHLLKAGVPVCCSIAPEMWHAYVLYGVEEAEDDFVRIIDFVREVFAK